MTTRSITAPTTPDLQSYLRIHRCLRTSAAKLEAEASRPANAAATAALACWFRGFAGEIRCHHHIEDELLFPALAARVMTYGEHAPRLDRDHDEVDELLDTLDAALRCGDRDSAGSAAVALRTHLDEHLQYEDDEIVPLFERHFSGAEFDALNAKAVRMTSPRQLVFTAPWLLAQLDGAERAAVLASVPGALHILWRATRGRYARLEARAFAHSR